MTQAAITEFTKCLTTMSHSRAGWDYYDMPKDQRVREDREEKDALKRAREIWAANPELHDALRDAFAQAKPLATMREIETTP